MVTAVQSTEPFVTYIDSQASLHGDLMRRYSQRLSAGLCVRCGALQDDDKSTCSLCRSATSPLVLSSPAITAPAPGLPTPVYDFAYNPVPVGITVECEVISGSHIQSACGSTALLFIWHISGPTWTPSGKSYDKSRDPVPHQHTLVVPPHGAVQQVYDEHRVMLDTHNCPKIADAVESVLLTGAMQFYAECNRPRCHLPGAHTLDQCCRCSLIA